MRCPCCGHKLSKATDVCSRCGSDIRATTLRHDVLVTVIYALVVLVLLSLFIYIGLAWHDSQLIDRWYLR